MVEPKVFYQLKIEGRLTFPLIETWDEAWGFMEQIRKRGYKVELAVALPALTMIYNDRKQKIEPEHILYNYLV